MEANNRKKSKRTRPCCRRRALASESGATGGRPTAGPETANRNDGSLSFEIITIQQVLMEPQQELGH
jgi:hypothetical protein